LTGTGSSLDVLLDPVVGKVQDEERCRTPWNLLHGPAEGRDGAFQQGHSKQEGLQLRKRAKELEDQIWRVHKLERVVRQIESNQQEAGTRNGSASRPVGLVPLKRFTRIDGNAGTGEGQVQEVRPDALKDLEQVLVAPRLGQGTGSESCKISAEDPDLGGGEPADGDGTSEGRPTDSHRLERVLGNSISSFFGGGRSRSGTTRGTRKRLSVAQIRELRVQDKELRKNVKKVVLERRGEHWAWRNDEDAEGPGEGQEHLGQVVEMHPLTFP
jgi:hypothetical protein